MSVSHRSHWRKLRIGFCGARTLGVECLRFLARRDDVEIVAISMPRRGRRVWWTDVVDEDEVEKLGLVITPWNEWGKFEFDLVVSVLHDRLFRKEHLERARLGIVNLHTARVPDYRGCNTFTHAVLNGEKRYGVTLHYVDEGVDSGPVIARMSEPILATDTSFSVYQRVQPVAYRLFCRVLPKVLALGLKGRRYSAKAQDEKRASYYSRTALPEREVDATWEAEKIDRYVRAFDFPPFEPAYIVVDGRRVYLTSGARSAFV